MGVGLVFLSFGMSGIGLLVITNEVGLNATGLYRFADRRDLVDAAAV